MIHYFEDSGQAYDDSQTGYLPDDLMLVKLENENTDTFFARLDAAFIEVQDGELLVVESEQNIAIMVSAWPTSIFEEPRCGAFHTVREDLTWQEVSDGKYLASYQQAVELAREKGWL